MGRPYLRAVSRWQQVVGPTEAFPGTPEKIAILRQRLERGESLWHPEDRRIEWELATMKCEMVSLNELWHALREREMRYTDDE